jgi:hypothetical protein
MAVVNSEPRWFQRHKWLLTVASLVVVVGIAEALLRISLFHTSAELASKDPEYYARSLDELWVYRHLFSATTPFAVGLGTADASSETSNEFYKSWATSLVPDAELGYRRTPNVHTPCHETTNLATRGSGDYSWSGPKIVFLGDRSSVGRMLEHIATTKVSSRHRHVELRMSATASIRSSFTSHGCFRCE